MNDIAQIVYTSDSGPILPEHQWHERITITKSKVALARNGRVSATHVNAGAWEWDADAQAVAALFAQLAGVDCARITRVEPDDPPDGGHAESYSVTYGRGQTCALVYDPGVDYTGGDLIVQPVRAFIQGMRLPAEAASRFGLSQE